tara:strand:- start:40 stop:150 length:111 start_codon:yes stop_codon:yes gene_type:complete
MAKLLCTFVAVVVAAVPVTDAAPKEKTVLAGEIPKG